MPDVVERSPELEALTPQRPAHLLGDRRADPLPAGGAADGRRQHRRPERALPPDRRRAADRDRREAAAAGRSRRRQAAAPPLADPRPRARGRPARHPDPVPGPVGSRQRPARVPPPPAAESDPGRARRRGRADGRSRRAAGENRGGEPARGRPQSGRPGARAAGQTAARGGRARRHPHLPRVADRAALGQRDQGQPRHQTRAPGPQRRPLRPRGRQGTDPRVPGGAQTEPGLARPDPLLRRPARGGEDEPRALDREGAGARVRAHLGRRRPRRGGDPRPPPHLHRGAAGDDHPRAPRRRLAQPRLHDRRDRQDGRRLPRRPGERDARGARPGPERHLPRPLPRPRLRPLRRRLHRHREPCSTRSRGRCSTGWR